MSQKSRLHFLDVRVERGGSDLYLLKGKITHTNTQKKTHKLQYAE